MFTVFRIIVRFLKNEAGFTSVEYALITAWALIAVEEMSTRRLSTTRGGRLPRAALGLPIVAAGAIAFAGTGGREVCDRSADLSCPCHWLKRDYTIRV